MEKCIICGSPCKIEDKTVIDGTYKFDCLRCGHFKIDTLDIITYREKISNLPLNQIACVSGWIREHEPVTINEPVIL